VSESRLKVGQPKATTAGIPGVAHSLEYAFEEMGIVRSVQVLRRLNQTFGFDCPSCAWPDPEERKKAEFCENGAKAVSWEATRKRVDTTFFATHSVAELREMDSHWLEHHGRLTEPMYLAHGASHYVPITWDGAFELIARRLRESGDPDRAAFYTSGRASNEAAFLYQLFARRLGTNNLPDCSNMCHESSGTALGETLGTGKGTVSLTDLTEHADLILLVGQNPGTNHPRMLTALEEAKERGATIVAVNPLPEAGLLGFKNPQRVRGVLGLGTPLADHFLQVRVNGDLALFAGVNKALVARESSGTGNVLDRDFTAQHTTGADAAMAHWRDLEWSEIERLSGVTRAEIETVVDLVLASKSVIACWAMGLTQHRNAVATIREIVNFLLLRGNIGRPGAGVCPVRGHSNVQGDRTMGISEKMPDSFLDALRSEFGFDPPREPGLDTVDTLRAMREGTIDVFMGLGGNFVAAAPDSALTEQLMSGLALTVHVATKLNRSHLCTGREALILPCLGRSERDIQHGPDGPKAQFVTVEDSMSMVHASSGHLLPASEHLRSEVSIVAGLGRAVFGDDDVVDWVGMGRDYRTIRRHIEHVVPGFESFESRVAQPGGFRLPNGARERAFATSDGKARFTVNELSAVEIPTGHLLLQSLRSHDQFNTTVYGLDDRYRGIKKGRRVVFVSPADLAELGFADGEMVDLVSVWSDGERRAPSFRIVAYPTPPGSAATYFPEANVLVPLDSTADGSNTPTSKSVVIRLERAAPAAVGAQR
jgi:molybdopterin-dependent oxidoreductase alpha subunit